MMRSFSVAIFLSCLGVFLPDRLAGEEKAMPSAPQATPADSLPEDAKDLVETLERMSNCATTVTHHKIPPKARLNMWKDGKTALVDGSLEGCDDLTMIVLSGEGLDHEPPKLGGIPGYRIYFFAKASGRPSDSHSAKAWIISYFVPKDGSGKVEASSDTTLFKRVDRDAKGEKVLNSIEVTMTTDDEKKEEHRLRPGGNPERSALPLKSGVLKSSVSIPSPLLSRSRIRAQPSA